jgi:cytochrome c oxidase subunit 2
VPGPRVRRSLLLAVPAAFAGALLAAPAAHAGLLFPESGGSPNADSIKTLYILLFVLGLVIFIGVEGLLIYALVKFKARKGAVAAQIHGNTTLEVTWTVGAAVLLIFITAFVFIKLGAIRDPKPSLIDSNGTPVAATDNTLFASTDQPTPKGPVLKIGVQGQQYVWAYSYPGKDKVLSYVDMVVPVGMTVILDITSIDVAHSWWIPKLGGKMDAVPGYTNKTWFRIPPDLLNGKPNGQVVFTGQCAELCGRNHANMYARVIGVSMDDYKKWLTDKATQIKAAQKAAAVQTKALQAQQDKGGSAP